MSKVFEFFSNAIKSCNVFTSPVNLRYKLDPDYNTFAGGLVSIILVILLVSVFFGAWMDLLNKQDISSSTEVIREFDPTYMSINTDDFMFAVGVNGLNLTDSSQKKYFDLTMTRIEMTKGENAHTARTLYQLEPCTLDHWQHLGDEFVETFKRQDLTAFLCVPRNTTIDIIGKWTSEKFVFFEIRFNKCVGSPECRSQKQIDDWIAKHSAFYFNFFYSNVLLNPDQQQPVKMFFEDKDFTMFSPTMSTFTNLYLGEYTMETDESIFPWTQSEIDSGFILNRQERESWSYMPNPTDAYSQLFLRKSDTRKNIQRKFRKLDDMLSYIGGLFGIITVAFGVIMKYYSQCSFELEMCQKIFDYHNKKQNKNSIRQSGQESQQSTQFNLNCNDVENKSQNKCEANDENQMIIEPKKFGFLDFLIYIFVYIPLKTVYSVNWRRMQIYQESLQEMRYKLDISQLMEKLAFYDRSINALFDENQLKLLYLQEKFNFQEVREQRNMLELRDGIIANLQGQKEQDSQDSIQETQLDQKKKTLKEIAQRNSKRLRTFVGASSRHLFEFMSKKALKSRRQNTSDVNLPAQIKQALKSLDSKIQKGDAISTRIYNGLQYELLETFEKSKMNKNNYHVTSKKLKLKPLPTMNHEIGKGMKGLKKKQMTSFAEILNHFSATSINQLKE